MAAKQPAKDYFDRLADWMRENGVKNPREIPDSVVEELQK